MRRAAQIGTPECAAETADGPIIITSDCIDSAYSDLVVTQETDETVPVVHHKVSGYFNNTNLQFNIYFPPKETWQGRFFQSVYPTQDANADGQTIGFGSDSGAYTVQITGSSGYRADAAAAKFSKTIAAKYYQYSELPIYGYVYGGSGGSYMAVGAVEETVGVWDGAVIFVQAIPVSIPNVPAARAFAGLVLRNQSAQIIDAVRPGGSGDPYDTLSAMQRGMLQEATALGIPLHKWEDFDKVADTFTLSILASTVQAYDETYADDFWSAPGYLGSEDSELGAFFRSLKFDVNVTIGAITLDSQGAPVSFDIQGLPALTDARGLEIQVYGTNSSLVGFLQGTVDNTLNVITVSTGNDQAVLDALHEGAKIGINNHWFLALHVYYRYQIPRRPGFYEWDQFLDDDGQPIYPQRAVDVPAMVAAAVSGGATHTGKIKFKVIVVDNLWDSDAWSPHADWYRTQVRESLGDQFHDNYRLYYNDHADHNLGPPGPNRTAYLITYDGIVQQALRDVSSWVEAGKVPPQSTKYSINNSQIVVPALASDRLGIQPTVDLKVNDAASASVQVGQSVTLKASVLMPPEGGKIVSAGWDILGTGEFSAVQDLVPIEATELQITVSYPNAGTFIAGIKVTAERYGNPNATYALVANIGRARVTVS
ncbi:hypothetical protein GQ53DRAFT_779340 [Thozetella sp. PMI_491]|nr:hypothetical protein GQ53DRAFT_779340 [Thozetella sp. PMI_491]